jgi:hypothetical protein
MDDELGNDYEFDSDLFAESIDIDDRRGTIWMSKGNLEEKIQITNVSV